MDDNDIIEDSNKYDNRLAMDLCLEEDENGLFTCNNKLIPGDDFCKKHSYKSQTVDSEGYIKDEKLLIKYYVKEIINKYHIFDFNNIFNTIDKYKEKEVFYNNKYKKDNISFHFFKKGSIRYTWYNGKIRGKSHKRGNPFQCDDCDKTDNINDYKIGSLVDFYCKECAIENVKCFIEFNKRIKNENYN